MSGASGACWPDPVIGDGPIPTHSDRSECLNQRLLRSDSSQIKKRFALTLPGPWQSLEHCLAHP